MLIWVTDKVVPVVVALAAVEMVKDVALGMVLMVTVSGIVLVAVNVTVAVAVAASVNVKLVALLTDVATVSLAGIPVPEIIVPADNEIDTGETIVTMGLPLVMLAVKVVVVVVVFGIPLPLMVIPVVKALVEAVLTVVLLMVVSAVMVEVVPVLVTQMLFELWQATQNVGLVELLYWVDPRLGDTATPSRVTLDVSPSWL
jgi:hypothetical protein